MTDKLSFDTKYLRTFQQQLHQISPYNNKPITYIHINFGANTCIVNKPYMITHLHPALNTKVSVK